MVAAASESERARMASTHSCATTGVTCINPIAFCELRARGLKNDSSYTIAFTSAGSSPCFSAVAAISLSYLVVQ